MTKPLLIEIGVEELPAVPFLKELPNIEKKWLTILEKYDLVSSFEFYYTPRRLVLWHSEFKIKQDDRVEEQFGAPISIAYKDGLPTGAAQSFATKCGVNVEELQTAQTQKGEVLYHRSEIKGVFATKILNSMINEFITSLSFGKSMRWGNLKESFIRPIRWLSVVLDNEIVEAELFGVKSSNFSYGHKMVSFESFNFRFAGDYFHELENFGVNLYPEKREKIILEQIKELEKIHNIKVELDEELLNEVVAITEFPTALLGSFDEEFLNLPKEVIVTSMKEHQRYFAVTKNEELTNNFVVVSNAKTDDFSLIVKGNEKVLRPRLADAMFFYKNDIRSGLDSERLKSLQFVDGLGSLYDKTLREMKIGEYLASEFNLEEKELLNRAIMLSKADLLSEMVYEFTELQGLMGYYYAKEANEDEKVYLALKEQYYPVGENSELPSSKFSSIVAMSNKFDNLLGLFSIGKIPTGSKDPYALRRSANGIVKIAIEQKLDLDFERVIEKLGENYKNLDKKVLVDFFNERLFKIFDVNPSILKAVLGSNEKSIYKIAQKIDALNPIVLSDSFKEYNSTFKRVANIIKDAEISNAINIDENLLSELSEIELYKNYSLVVSKNYETYDEELKALFSLKPYLDKFFDEVKVNCEDENLKQNRQNLILKVYSAFKNIADIKEITL